MDAIRQQLLRIQQQLSGLSASQKMLTISLVVIMVMTMFYWSRYAGSSEMVALLDQSLSAEEISTIKSSLASRGVRYEVTGDRIMVPADKRFEIIADLGYAQLLPRDMKDAFETIVMGNENPFRTTTQSEQIYNHARERKLATIISMWPGVKSATVMIDGTSRRNPTRSITPTASVAISLKNGESPNKRLADAAVNLVAGAQAGLTAENVKVMINGQVIKLASASHPWDGDNPILKAKADAEQQYAQKILSVLAYIPNAYATVSVDLNTKTQLINEKKVDPKGKVEALLSQTTTSSSSTNASEGAEGGAMANISVMNVDAPSPGSSRNEESTEIRQFVDTSVTNTQITAPAGDAVPVAAAVRVPDSYFISIWKRTNPNATTEPTEAELESLVKMEMPSIRDAVKMATNIKDDSAISVARYIDVAESLREDAIQAAGLASLPSGIGFGAKEIAIGVLAVISLFMVSMMVRKSVPQPMVQSVGAGKGASETVNSEPGPITAVTDLAGEVGEGGMLLSGHELSDQELEAQQVIEQVGTMVKENPEVAANLVKRWLNRD
ncbi:MAG: beta-cystathionase [Phycisphaerae bacterium]|jgi:flagellar biosynthesis/type III secretory pathway M-ring protein FliF/YscJ|nr:MAG: beta-cystathionase [Phycisphaerae bacterium]